MKIPTINIVIVNWNAGSLLREALGSIAKVSGRSLRLEEIVIVDNASSDNSLESLEAGKIPLRIIRNDVNRGFGVACNQGAMGITADYLLFLNPDVRLSAPSLEKPLSFLEDPQNDRVGIVGIQMINDYGQICRSCARFPATGTFFSAMFGLDRLFPGVFPGHFMVEWDHRDSREVDQVMGSFFLVRSSLFRLLGGFDERFFVYFEEVDFAVRARQAGYRTYFLSDVAAHHKGGGTSRQVKGLRLFYSLRSRLQYAYKHFTWASATVLSIGTLLLEPVTRMLFAMIHFSGSALVETLEAYGKLWRIAPRLIATRGLLTP